ncbi:zinc-dependent metalloprotease [Maricaulis sp.]|uniref:zinc-dependent metalloprotease n=1 Tax=Maricaulis sp. TaxID=1486257 RepID=UPI0026098BDF|nr:zinc-dependent metalloprotease [Maricaulis sp.]
MTLVRAFIMALSVAGAGLSAPALAQSEIASLNEAVEGMERREGFLPLYVDSETGRILAELSPQEDGSLGRMIYTARLTSGLGSNPVGLDRGRGTSSHILRFFRVANQVFAEFENTTYVARGAGADETRATQQSFARSIIWQTGIEGQANGRVVIDLTEFLKRDPVDAISYLSGTNQGSFSIDAGRSAPLTDTALTFPQNVEIDALLTLQSSAPGSEVRAVTPYPRAVTLTVHHSFVALPDAGYTPRFADQRAGSITSAFYDMAAPLDEPLRRVFALRHRLNRIDPSASSGPVEEPIIYYVDRGAPDVIRDALIEGGQWWADSFEAAGFEDAYRVELLPEGAHPLDVRYNVIQWVHRQTRGWSYGASVIDPRTGEILKGHVTLGSQRVRQDRMIFEGLLGVEETGSGSAGDPLEIALARIRQLSAHEIGHTIGLAHNFAASINDRASVMDYPAPWVRLDDAGAIDISNAYDTGIGEWDTAAISWLYGQAATAEEEHALIEQVLADARADGLLYITDRHARGTGSAHPLANLWDNGPNPVEELLETLDVRDTALANFGPHVLRDDQPLSSLRGVFAPIYLYHRYQVEAAAKTLGGVYFDYELNGPAAQGLSAAPAADQTAALSALIATLDPARLDIADTTLALLAPAPFADYDQAVTRELFESGQYPAFSRRDAAAAAARITLAASLSPARIDRMADQSSRDALQLSPLTAFEAFEAAIFVAPRDEDARLGPVREAVQAEYAAQLLRVAGDERPVASSWARDRLETLARGLPTGRYGRAGRRSHRIWLARHIESGLDRIDEGETPRSTGTTVPPGSPIGAATCWHCDSAELMGLGR